jgi:hypothetical protein
MQRLEDGDEDEDGVEEADGVGHEPALVAAVHRLLEQAARGVRRPRDGHRRQHMACGTKRTKAL